MDNEAARPRSLYVPDAFHPEWLPLICARLAAERIKRDAASGVDREVERAKQALRDEAADLSVELAGKLLQEHVTDGDRDRLVDEFVAEIEAGPGTPPPAGSQGGLH